MGRQIDCEVQQVMLKGERGIVRGVSVTCGECQKKAECFGRSYRSVRRALMMLREQCTEGDSFFYATTDGSDDPEVNPDPREQAGYGQDSARQSRSPAPDSDEGGTGMPRGLPRRHDSK